MYQLVNQKPHLSAPSPFVESQFQRPHCSKNKNQASAQTLKDKKHTEGAKRWLQMHLSISKIQVGVYDYLYQPNNASSLFLAMLEAWHQE